MRESSMGVPESVYQDKSGFFLGKRTRSATTGEAPIGR